MNNQVYDYFGSMFRRYFRPAVDEYPQTGGVLVHRLMTSTDEIQDRVAEARHAAYAWSKADLGTVDIASEFFMIAQCGLMYGARFAHPEHPHYYLATPAALFDAFVDQVECCELHAGDVIGVDRRCSRDLSAAHPMDAALRRILDEHETLRVNVG